jgi:putative tryptophan/tyrosine transport system substrate-binding protein
LQRRQVIAGLGALAATALLHSAQAQRDGRQWRIGFLAPNRRPANFETHRYYGFVQGLRDLGYVDGSNLSIEWRYAQDDPARLAPMARELIQRPVDLIVAAGTPAALAAREATTSVPIVMMGIGDPVASGLVKRLGRPGGNATGISLMNPDLGGKWLELARALVPSLSRLGALLNAGNPAAAPTLQSLRKAGKVARVTIVPVEVSAPKDLPAAFHTLKEERVMALVIQNEAMLRDESPHIARTAIAARLPTIAGAREFAEAGCLATYGSNLFELYRRAANYVDKILRGASPGELPVEQPTSYELVLNLRSAKALGIAPPKELLLRADRVIE